MIGKVHIFNSKSSKIVKTIDYDKIVYDEEFRKNIKKNYLNKDYMKLVCGCNKSIELNIDSLYRIYHKHNSDIYKHNKYCIKHPNYKVNSKVPGWSESERSITVTLSKIDNSIDYLTLKKFIYLLNFYSWNTFIFKYSSFPKDKFSFLNRIFGISNNIKIKDFGNKTLNSLFFNINKSLSDNEIAFTYMYLKKFYVNSDNTVKIVGEYGDNRLFSFLVDKKTFYKKYFNVYSKNIKSNFAFSGFVKKNNNIVELIEFEIFRVNNIGLICNNEFEEKLFNVFYNNNILFIRPFKPIPFYGGYTPTAILVGSNNKDIYVEIFDSKTKESLDIRKFKINTINTFLKNTHLLIKWDVYNDDNIPSLNSINLKEKS